MRILNSLAFAAMLIFSSSAIAEVIETLALDGGKFEILRDQDFNQEVRFNGKAVLKGTFDYLGVEAREKVGAIDLIVLSESHGNSGASYRVVAIDAGNGVKVLDHDQLFSTGEVKVARKPDGIEIDLGYQDKKHKLAQVRIDGASARGVMLAVAMVAPGPDGRLSSDECSWLYGQVLDECVAARADDGSCNDVQGGLSMSSQRGIFALSEKPGFSAAMIEPVCQAACKSGRKPVLAAFRSQTCGLK